MLDLFLPTPVQRKFYAPRPEMQVVRLFGLFFRASCACTSWGQPRVGVEVDMAEKDILKESRAVLQDIGKRLKQASAEVKAHGVTKAWATKLEKIDADINDVFMRVGSGQVHEHMQRVGSKGGKARAKALSADERRAIGKRGAEARWKGKRP